MFIEFAHNSHLSLYIYYRKLISIAIEDNLTILKNVKL